MKSSLGKSEILQTDRYSLKFWDIAVGEQLIDIDSMLIENCEQSQMANAKDP